jgi:hypothetical protein
VTLHKDSVYEDFGFSVSDGLYERGSEGSTSTASAKEGQPICLAEVNVSERSATLPILNKNATLNISPVAVY